MTAIILIVLVLICASGFVAGLSQGVLLHTVLHGQAETRDWVWTFTSSTICLYLALFIGSLALRHPMGKIPTAHLLLYLLPYSTPLWALGVGMGWREAKLEEEQPDN